MGETKKRALNWESVGPDALALLETLNSFEDFDMPLADGDCGYDDASEVNEVRERIATFIRDCAHAASFGDAGPSELAQLRARVKELEGALADVTSERDVMVAGGEEVGELDWVQALRHEEHEASLRATAAESALKAAREEQEAEDKARIGAWFDAGRQLEEFRDALKAAEERERELRDALLRAEIGIDHALHRPHEHNPLGPQSKGACEVLLRAEAAVRAALATPAPAEATGGSQAERERMAVFNAEDRMRERMQIRIDAAEAEVQRKDEALRPLAEIADKVDAYVAGGGGLPEKMVELCVRREMFDAARAALSPSTKAATPEKFCCVWHETGGTGPCSQYAANLATPPSLAEPGTRTEHCGCHAQLLKAKRDLESAQDAALEEAAQIALSGIGNPRLARFRDVAEAIRALKSKPAPSEPRQEVTPERKPTHRCKICGASWIYWPPDPTERVEALRGGWWSVCTPQPWKIFPGHAQDRPHPCGPCCDMAPMGDQIEALPAAPSPSSEKAGGES